MRQYLIIILTIVMLCSGCTAKKETPGAKWTEKDQKRMEQLYSGEETFVKTQELEYDQGIISVSNDGQYLLTREDSSQNGTKIGVYQHSGSQYDKIHTVECPVLPADDGSICWSHDNKKVAISSYYNLMYMHSYGVFILDIEAGKLTTLSDEEFGGRKADLTKKYVADYQAAWSADDLSVYFARYSTEPNECGIWKGDVESGKVVLEYPVDIRSIVQYLVVYKDSIYAAVTNGLTAERELNGVYLFQDGNMKQLTKFEQQIKGGRPESLRINRDGTKLIYEIHSEDISSGLIRAFYCYDTLSQEIQCLAEVKVPNNNYRDVLFTPDGGHIVFLEYDEQEGAVVLAQSLEQDKRNPVELFNDDEGITNLFGFRRMPNKFCMQSKILPDGTIIVNDLVPVILEPESRGD